MVRNLLVDETFRRLKKSPFEDVYNDISNQFISGAPAENIMLKHNWTLEEYKIALKKHYKTLVNNHVANRYKPVPR